MKKKVKEPSITFTLYERTNGISFLCCNANPPSLQSSRFYPSLTSYTKPQIYTNTRCFSNQLDKPPLLFIIPSVQLNTHPIAVMPHKAPNKRTTVFLNAVLPSSKSDNQKMIDLLHSVSSEYSNKSQKSMINFFWPTFPVALNYIHSKSLMPDWTIECKVMHKLLNNCNLEPLHLI